MVKCYILHAICNIISGNVITDERRDNTKIKLKTQFISQVGYVITDRLETEGNYGC